MRVQRKLLTSLMGVGVTIVTTGCTPAPPPPRVPVPAAPGQEVSMQHDEVKPLPPPQPQYQDAPPGPAFDDVPLVSQQPPEEPAYVDAYNRVGHPRITVFVNRTLEGKIIPVNPTEPDASYEYSKKATTGVKMENTETSSSGSTFGQSNTDKKKSFEMEGPGEYKETSAVYLKPGQYDEVSAKSLDYEAVENVLTDYLSGSGQVTIVSPMMTRQRLTDDELKDLQSGRPQMLSEIAQKLDADVLVQVQAHPTKQTQNGLEVRIIAESINTRGGQSIGRAFIDVPPPLEKTQINKYTRFLARKLMDGMTGTWTMAGTYRPKPAPAAAAPTPAPAPTVAPAPPTPAPANPSPATTELPATMPTNP